MPTLTRLGLNAFWLLLARVGAQLFALALTVLLARRLGEVDFGRYAWIAAVVALANTLTTFGTDTLIIRELARDERATPALLGATLWLQLALSALWLAGVWLAPLASADVRNWLWAFSLTLIPLAFYSAFSAALRAHQRMLEFAALNVAVAALQVLGALAFVHTPADFSALALVMIAAQAAGALLAATLCARTVPRFAVDWRLSGVILSAILWAALPLVLLTGLALAYQRLGVFALLALAGEAATGWYTAALRLVEGLKLGHYATMGALLPALSQSRSTPAARRAWLWLLALSAALAAFVSLLAAPLVHLLYGARFGPSVPALQILAWSLLPYTVSAYLSVRLVAASAEHLLLAGTLLGFAVALGLNVWLIPPYGVAGACVSVALSEVVLAALLWALSRRLNLEL